MNIKILFSQQKWYCLLSLGSLECSWLAVSLSDFLGRLKLNAHGKFFMCLIGSKQGIRWTSWWQGDMRRAKRTAFAVIVAVYLTPASYDMAVLWSYHQWHTNSSVKQIIIRSNIVSTYWRSTLGWVWPEHELKLDTGRAKFVSGSKDGTLFLGKMIKRNQEPEVLEQFRAQMASKLN